ncbi:hypothetical protein [Klebsiella pneumoniae]|uniref:hypothetical protein n=1 Tax=Klebsiella pneumoniae TaxID=573 RepID=UPI001D1985AB|nr:hypothetical protein [Klebsiella pneumoniae]
MMVENDTSSVEYQLSTSTGPFDIPFYFIENGHIVAELYTQNGDDFNKTTLTVDVDYYLNGAGDKDGGQLTLLSAHSGAVIPPFFGALKSRGHAACAKRCFGV